MELFVLDFIHSQVFWTGTAFFILLGILGKFVVPQITAVLDARIEKVAGEIRGAEDKNKEAEETLAAYTEKLAEARKEAAEVVSRARAEAEALAKKRIADVEAELTRKAEDARKSIAAARDEALRDVQAEVAALTVQIAEKLIHQSVDKKTAQSLTDQALKQGLNG
ncbi:MAG: ATP synthase F0 subunit B [Alphaproteobacteria bacterium CG_4_10_14_0_8_um_filter_53_9]|nr:MAG: ATP synthase F0 subunit B [Alphaproteobacteria bacterium CG_4_10_14_0_8_um_filter_53_9]